MHRWKLIIEYEGSEFSGWQRQKKGRTVQQELEEAFSTLFSKKINVMGQGRTDSGVHAEGQVAHVDLPVNVDSERVLSAMRGLLPHDMAVISAEKVSDDFHARFDAVSRCYKYQLATRPVPLKRHLYWLLLNPIDESVLHECAAMIKGIHDFRNFAKEDTGSDSYGSTECEVIISEWTKKDHIWIYKIEGNRFLRHMVRRIVGSTIHTSIGKISPEIFKELLSGAQVKRKAHSAPAHGLILERVNY
jgi:tRNA pseudouridine38-40 synthase